MTPQEFAKLFVEYTRSKAGVMVDKNTAVKVSAVFACVNLISQTVAALPLGLYETVERGKRKATNHPLYPLLHSLPNHATTHFDFWQMLMVNLLLTGDGFAVLKRDGDNIIREMWNVPSSAVTIFRNPATGEKYYQVTESGKVAKYYPENMLHVQGMRYNNTDTSLDPIAIAREALGLSLATEEYGAKYFSNGANPGAIIEYQTEMSDEAFTRFKESFNEKYSGIGNSSKVLFLEGGAKYNKIGNAPEESQFLETRRFQAIEIARFWNVPPPMIMELERSTFSNMEQLSINFVQYCLTSWLVKNEQTIYRDCLSEKDRKRYFAKFNVKGLLRGDITARKEFYNTMIQNGVYSPNDVLEMEDENGYEGGDIHMVNGNMIPVSMLEDYIKQKMKGGEKDGKAGETV